MRNRNQFRDDKTEEPEPREEDTSGRLTEARNEGRSLIDAAARALSGDSRKFLRASRQQGGQ